MSFKRPLPLLSLFAFLPVAGCVMRPPFEPSLMTPVAPEFVKLSPSALEMLVVGVALYPDPLLEQVLDASMHPLALERATAPKVGLGLRSKLSEAVGTTPSSIVYLQDWPDVLSALSENKVMTARLGVAYRFQKEDVWAAIQSVRAKVAQNAAVRGSTDSGPPPGVVVDSSTVVPDPDVYVDALGVVAVTMESDPVVVAEIESLDSVVIATSGSIEGEFTTIDGVSGSVSGTNGTTTGGVKGGAAVVTGPNGQTVAMGGVAGGSITQTEDGATWQSKAVGGAVNTSTGDYVAGAHSGSGSVSQNEDGSVDWSRDAANAVVSSAGATTMEHHGDAHITGDGSGSYDGSTSVDSTHGSFSTDTHASDGQVSTTVTQGNGSQTTYTAGDGQVENSPKSTSSSATRSSGSTSERGSRASGSSASGSSRFGSGSERAVSSGSRSAHSSTPDFSSLSKDRVAAGTRGMQKSWGSMGERSGGSLGSSAQRGASGRSASFGGRSVSKPSGGRGGRHR